MRWLIPAFILCGGMPAMAAPASPWDPWATAESAPQTPSPAPAVSPGILFGAAAIRGYQVLLSPLLGGRCRFEPSCSRYTAACIASYGLLAGIWRGADRISRCHGFAELGGYPSLADGRLLDAPGR